ncbi:phage tail family protein [Lysinibacillus xylanilyticus]|uniref:phage tail family protein n=1 Tax=Lysinibacillus xylanilyticus TaxID=582475 RepID=UPI0038266B3C
METITYTNRLGESVTLGGPPFYLQKINGLGDVSAETQTQRAPYQDGSTYIDSTLDERFIDLEFLIVNELGEGYGKISEKRTKIARVLNPKLGLGILRYENESVVREIYCVAESVPIYPDDIRAKTLQKGLVTLRAPSPYWLTEETADQLTVWEGGLKFPLKLPSKFARMSLNKAKIILNDGNAETPFQAIFNGPATAPIKLINKTTGKYIEVKQSLIEGEKMIINTAFGQKRVTKVLIDGTQINAFHFITIGSSFFNLIQGNNLLDYSTGADYERAAVQIIYRNRYLAV